MEDSDSEVRMDAVRALGRMAPEVESADGMSASAGSALSAVAGTTASLATNRPLSCMWLLLWERHTCNTNWFDATCVRATLAAHGLGSPAVDGFIYSSRSLRAGPASAAVAIGIPIEHVRYIGEWSVDSSVPERKYIDKTYPHTSPAYDAAWRLFGWLRSSRPPPPHR